LVSNAGYLAEEIKDGDEGFLTDNDAWEKVFKLAVSGPEQVERIEKNVEKKALKRSNEKVAKIHLRIYKK